MSRPFAVIGFTVFLTAALLYNCETGVTAAALAAFAVALVVTLFIRKARVQRYLPCAFASGAVICALLLASNVYLYQPAVALNGSMHEIKATLISEPDLRYGNYYYTAKATEIDGETADLKLRLTFSEYPEAEPYDEISGTFSFYIPGSSSEDFIASHKANGIYIAAYPNRNSYSVNQIPESEKPFGKRIIDIRIGIRNAIYSSLPDERGALAVALIIGDKSGLPADVYSDFQASGISHVICVSGLHLSLWSLLVFWLLKKMRIGDRVSSVICAAAVVMFMLVAGMSYSVVRSGIMMLVYLFSNILIRQRDPLNSLGFAVTVIALFNPFAMGSVSLQLSVLATLGIILCSENIMPKIKLKINKIDNRLIRKSVDFITSSLMTTVSATALTLPVSLGIYRGFNFASLGANLVAVPVSSAAIVVNALGAAVHSVFSIDFISKVGGLLCTFLIRFADFISNIKWLVFRVEEEESLIIICAVMAVCIFALLMAYHGRPMPVFSCTVCGFVFVFLLLGFSFSGQRITKLVAADCGNGTSVAVSKGGETLLIGCGGTEFLAPMYIGDAVESCGGSIDALFIPEKTQYTSSFLKDVVSDYGVGGVYCSEPDFETKLIIGDIPVYDVNSDYNSKNFSVSTTDDGSATLIKTEDAVILVCYGPIYDFTSLPNEFIKADIMIFRGDYPESIADYESDFVIMNAENFRGKIISDELNSMGIKAASTAGNGNITVKADDGFISAYR